MQLTHDILERLDLLEAKFAAMGQDIQSYLDGLLHADYLTYWDYIHIDTLLSLQNTRTPFPDERIFIMYHQITELYFRLILDAIEQAVSTPSVFKRQIGRVNCYFEQLIQSYDIMVDGMDKDEFLKFRMSLLPASGFQSAQFRCIEIMSTDFNNLLHFSKKELFKDEKNYSQLYEALYWKQGATELATGKKTLTLNNSPCKTRETSLKNSAEINSVNDVWVKYVKLSV